MSERLTGEELAEIRARAELEASPYVLRLLEEVVRLRAENERLRAENEWLRGLARHSLWLLAGVP